MISNWEVLQNVVQRYGRFRDEFTNAAEKLKNTRGSNSLSPLIMEDNDERLKLRMAREGDGNMSTSILVERIMGNSVDFQNIYVLELLSRLSAAVCRISQNGIALGTGFLIGDQLLITNHHVIHDENEARGMTAEFEYEQTPPPQSRLKDKVAYRLDPSIFFLTSTLHKVPGDDNSGLDFTIVGVELLSVDEKKPITDYRPVLLDGNGGKIIKGESCIIIQHPGGEPKKIVLKNNAFFSETDSRMVYETDTLPGASGSMVVALGTCEIVALHHAGLPRTDDNNNILTKTGNIAPRGVSDSEIDWIGNEGIKVSRIIQAVKTATLPASMEGQRKILLRTTNEKSKELSATTGMTNTVIRLRLVDDKARNKNTDNKLNRNKSENMDTSKGSYLLVTAVNDDATISNINRFLHSKYKGGYEFRLSMPSSAAENDIELFSLKINETGDIAAIVAEVRQIPGIINAEGDEPLALNADNAFLQSEGKGTTESIGGIGDGYGTPNEQKFLNSYRDKSVYVTGRSLDDIRRWNHYATNFDMALSSGILSDPQEAGIRIVQFDTGYSDSPKVFGNYDFDHDHNFLDGEGDATDARDREATGVLRQPGHGTRTGSLLIGNEPGTDEGDGNFGLLRKTGYKLTPYRISSSVILINRQQQLANALDSALTQGFDIITMSMGLPPTMATARMAKKAYDKGLIWCCAAGNEVQFVIAPAVYPGTIAVAASNPLDTDWKGSSRGDAVDITAPGQDVYVPILFKDGTVIKDSYAYGDGTSYATPHVAAAAAYWLAKHKEKLNTPEYHGWRRVEAFRMALSKAGEKRNLPGGFGAGILNYQVLMDAELTPANKLVYAYDSWNEHAFFASLQGYGELVKTYWNKIHSWFGGGSANESISGTVPMSPVSAMLESALFGAPVGSSYESTSLGNTQDTTLTRLNTLTNIIQLASKK